MDTDDIDLLFGNVPNYDFDEDESLKYEESEPTVEEPDLYAYELYHSEHVEKLPAMDMREIRLIKKLKNYSEHIVQMTKVLEACVEQTAQLRIFEAIREPNDKVVLHHEHCCNGTRFTVLADPEFFEGSFTALIRFQTHKPRLLTIQHPITFDDKGCAKFLVKDVPEDVKIESADLCVCSTIDEVVYDKMLKTYNKLKKKQRKKETRESPPPAKRRRIKKLNICDALSALCVDPSEVGTSPDAWAPLIGGTKQPGRDIKDVKPDKKDLAVAEERVTCRPLPSDLNYEKRLQSVPFFDEPESSSSESDDDNIKREIFDRRHTAFDPTKLDDTDDPTTELMPILHSIPMHISTR